MSNYVIEVVKAKHTVGCIYFGYGMTFDTLAEISKIRKLIDNYNENLINANIPYEVLAHRFLEKENVECDRVGLYSVLFSNTEKYVKKIYPEYVWLYEEEEESLNLSSGVIAISKKDILICKEDSHERAIINLDKNVVSFINFFDIISIDDYMEKTKISTSEFYKIPTLPSNLSLDNISFNQLEDFYELFNGGSKEFRIGDCVVKPVVR